jgi:hypothetical protein
MEFPAVSHTRVEFWQEKHYTRNGMWWFTLLFGFFGLHHLLLKSPQTAIIMVIANMFLLGYPWLYDLIQLSKPENGGLSDKELEEFGLGHAFGPLGLAKGMWVSEDYAPKYSPYKDRAYSDKPLTFFLYCLLCPIGIIGSFIAGDYGNAMARAANFFPLGFILIGFVFELICVVSDLFTVVFSPGDLIFGVKRPLFYRNSILDDYIYPGLSMNADGHSPRLMPTYFTTNMANYENSKAFKESAAKSSTIRAVTSETEVEAGANATASENANKPNTTPSNIPSNNANTAPANNKPQTGGAAEPEKSSLDYFAFFTMIAVIGGGLLISAGRSINGGSSDKDDSPPNARDV